MEKPLEAKPKTGSHVDLMSSEPKVLIAWWFEICFWGLVAFDYIFAVDYRWYGFFSSGWSVHKFGTPFQWVSWNQRFKILKDMWRFPEIGVSPYHPFFFVFFSLCKPSSYWGAPMTMEPPTVATQSGQPSMVSSWKQQLRQLGWTAPTPDDS